MISNIQPSFDNRHDNNFFEDNFDYPIDYEGQELGDSYVFVPEIIEKLLLKKGLSRGHYLQLFAKEVAAAQTLRALEYLKAYPTGQRYLWTFPQVDFVLLSLVVLLPVGPRPVIWICNRSDIHDAKGQFLHHAELCIRWIIESSVGTSTHPERM